MRNIKAVSLALLLFIYPILVLSSVSLRYTETIHRVTTGRTFDETIFGSQLADSLAALGFLLLFTALTFRSTPVRLASVTVFAVGIALYAINSDVLVVIGIATLPSLVAIISTSIIANRRTRGKSETSISVSQRFDMRRVMAALLIIIIILEVGALTRWVSYPLYPTEIYSDPSWRFAELESALFHSLALLSPFLVVLIAFSFFYKWFMPDLFKRMTSVVHGRRQNSDQPAYTPSQSPQPTNSEHKVKPRPVGKYPQMGSRASAGPIGKAGPVVATYDTSAKTSTIAKNAHWVILSAALIIAPLVVIYPHLPGVNPTGSGVSTDERYYVNWMSQLRANSGETWTDALANAFTINNGDRPLTLLLILAIANLTGSPDLTVIRFLPVALAPALVLANYVLIRYALRSKNEGRLKIFASIGAVFAALSPQIVVGEYSGFLANWIALVAGCFAFYFLIKGWESQNRGQSIRSFGILFVILLSMMLIHVYTWAHLLAIMLLFGGISYIFARKTVAHPKIKIIMILLVIGTAFSIDLVRSSYFSTPAAIESDSALSENILPQDTSGRWNRIYFTMSSYVGGFLSNPVLLLLGLLWMVKADLSKGFDRLLLSMFFISAIPIMFGSIEFQTRVLYNIPFQIPALLALYAYGGVKSGLFRSLLIVAVVATLATYTLHSMANLYLELPDGFVMDKQFLLP